MIQSLGWFSPQLNTARFCDIWVCMCVCVYFYHHKIWECLHFYSLWWLILCVNLTASDIWSNITLGLSVGVFLDKYQHLIDRLSKADCSPWCEWALSSQVRNWIEQKRLTLLQIRGNSVYLPWAGTLVFSGLWTEMKTSAFWVSSLLTSLWNYTCVSSLLTADLGTPASFHNHMS